MPPIRTAEGDSVGRTAAFFDQGSDIAAAAEGSNVAGPIRTTEGDSVGRTAIYGVEGGVAVPLTTLGVDPATVGEPGGPAGPLDQNGEIPLSQMPIDGLNYQGAWDASTNTPTLADGVGTAGDLYRVSVAGSQDLGSGVLVFEVGDHVIYEGSIWQQLDPAQVIDWGDIQGTLANQTDLQAALDAKLDLTGGTLTGDLHMSEQNIDNLANGTTARQAVNFEQLDAKLDPADVVGDNPVSVSNQLGVLHVALTAGSDGEAIVTLGGVPTWGNQTANAVGAVATTEVGQPNGVASLGADGIVPAGQLPDPITAPADLIADATLQNQHPTVQLCDATTGAITLSLVADTPGKTFTVKKTDASANTVTISPPVPIDGQATAVLTNQYDYITIVRGNSDNWHIIAST